MHRPVDRDSLIRRSLRRRRPADWEPIDSVLLAWPHRPTTWPGRLSAVETFYTRWAREIARHATVRILAGGRGVDASQFLGDAIEVWDVPTDDAWIRDYGPQFIWESRPDGDDSMALVAFEYNSWGGKYPPFDQDCAVADHLSERLELPLERSPLVMEGGGIDFDGRGRALINQTCVIDPSRNPNWTIQQVEEELRIRIGIEQVVWMDVPSPSGDDTDGHIDQLARWLSPNRIAIFQGHPDGPHDQFISQRVEQQLRRWIEVHDADIELVFFPAVTPRKIHGQEVPQSYCNFHRLGPDVILMPTFGPPGDAVDDHAAGLLSEWTGAAVTKMDCRDMVYGLGALHCASIEIPKPSPPSP